MRNDANVIYIRTLNFFIRFYSLLTHYKLPLKGNTTIGLFAITMN